MEPVTLPVVPSEVAVAVDVTEPMLMNPPSMEMPPTVALASAVAVVDGACDDDVAEMAPMPTRRRRAARGLPEPDGAGVLVLVSVEPEVELSSPRVAVAVLPEAVLEVSMFTPVLSVLAEFGACGNELTACTGQIGAGGTGTPGTRRLSSGPALATTWPG